MRKKQEIVDRFNALQSETKQNDNDFRKILSIVTGKTLRTIRRWYALETVIQDCDLRVIAKYFGQQENWLKFGDINSKLSMIDQIMASKHYGVTISRNGKAEDMNHTFIEMMDLQPEKLKDKEACEFVLSFQPEQTIALHDISAKMAEENGSHHHNITMQLGDEKLHSIDITTLNINNGRLLRIFMDKGQIVRTQNKMPKPACQGDS
jgi:hypothetical protein